MAKSEDLKIFAPSAQGEDRHLHLMKELDRIIRYLFDDEVETSGKGDKTNGK
jgi:hypothetical protein